MTLQQQACGLINRLSDESVYTIREGHAGIGLRSFTDTASMFAALDSEPGDSTSLTDLLTGILKGGSDPNIAREESLKKKYELADRC